MRFPRWVPSAISVLRIALVPVWVLLALEARRGALAGDQPSGLGPIAVLLAIGASDVVDGILARRFGLATNLGAVLDAVADKVAQISCVTFLALAGAPAFTPLPVWLMASLAARDLLLSVGWWIVYRRRGEVKTEHRWHGRASSSLLFVLILAALAGVARSMVVAGAALVLFLVVPSTVAYALEGWRQLRVDRAERHR